MAGKGRPKGSADIAPRIRGAFIRACEINKQRGKDLTTLIADSLIDDPINTLKAMASFNPKQMNVDMTARVEVADIIALAQQRQQHLKDITPEVSKLQDQNRDNPKSEQTRGESEG